ncbi:MAG: phage tail protein [Jatrophihabitans sp.]|uniref:phage tail protein n=1 Tax=Jatrophihabitans sp. TaxID=1932789 RepID=UPI003F81ECE4
MSTPFIGEIRMFGGNFAPVGWLFCQGQLLPIDQYDALFNLIGTTYGGDGQSTFALPDLQSRVPVHQGSGYALGQTGGAEQVQLTASQIPQHTHGLRAASGPGTTASPSNAVWAGSTYDAYSDQTPDTAMSAAAVSYTGGNQPHENMPPFLVINFIIATEGIYPSPS